MQYVSPLIEGKRPMTGRHPRTACLLTRVEPGQDSNEIQEKLLDLAFRFSPTVEDGRDVAKSPGDGLGLVRIDARGLGLLHESPKALLEATVTESGAAGFDVVAVMADSPFTAAVLAGILAYRRSSSPAAAATLVSTPGEDRRYMARLPLAALYAPEAPGLPPEALEQLELLAVRTIGGFAALPPSAVEKRFGSTGLRLQRLARGEDRRPLIPWHPSPPPRREVEPEPPADNLPALEALLHELLDLLDADLQRAGKGLTRLRATYNIDGGDDLVREIEIIDPMARAKDWMSLIQLDLQAHPPTGPVKRVSVRAAGTSTRERHCHDMFALRRSEESSSESGTGDPAALERVAARLRLRFGNARVGVPVLEDHHRPEAAFRIDPSLPASTSPAAPENVRSNPDGSLTLRLFKPRPVPVETDPAGHPRKLDEHPVTCSGPFPASGEWWSNPYDRLYFEVAAGEKLLWVYRDGLDGRWYVHGAFD